ncbi:MAG: hypothetical protein ABL952_07885 [Pyrinomonadaceae bacterium]
MERIQEEHYFYIAWHDTAADEYFLDVLCGTVAQYTIVIKLTPEEIERFKADSATLRELADKISYSPDSYRSRHIGDLDLDK